MRPSSHRMIRTTAIVYNISLPFSFLGVCRRQCVIAQADSAVRFSSVCLFPLPGVYLRRAEWTFLEPASRICWQALKMVRRIFPLLVLLVPQSLLLAEPQAWDLPQKEW